MRIVNYGLYLLSAGCLACLMGMLGVIPLQGCGEDDANQQLIGGECGTVEQCDDKDDDTPALECLTEFKGGYCGRKDCTKNQDCPEGSVCVQLETETYCFLVCKEKADCNQNREEINESNCSSSIDPVEGGEAKVCVPPSSGV